MADPFVGEIRVFPFDFVPNGWAACNGQLLPLSQNTALFSLLGTYYGGDGKSTFALPDLRGAAAMFWGQGPGLSDRYLGEQGGEQSITLLESEMPYHTHQLQAVADDATTAEPANAMLAQGTWNSQSGGGVVAMYATGAPAVTMAPTALAPSGGGLPHNNMQPYLAINYCIALRGVFPPRG